MISKLKVKTVLALCLIAFFTISCQRSSISDELIANSNQTSELRLASEVAVEPWLPVVISGIVLN